MRVSGTAGLVQVGHQTAYHLGPWSLVLEPRLPRAYTFRAVVHQRHDFWSTQRPLDLVVHVGAAKWVWCGIEPKFIGGEMEIDIGVRPQVSELITAKQEQGVL